METLSKNKVMRKGLGRVQFIACAEKIQELYKQGYDIKKIYEILSEEDMISMSYGAFYGNFRKWFSGDIRYQPEKVLHIMQNSSPTQDNVTESTRVGPIAEEPKEESNEQVGPIAEEPKEESNEQAGPIAEEPKEESNEQAESPVEATGNHQDSLEERSKKFALALQKNVDAATKRALNIPNNDDPEIRSLKDKLF